MKIVTGITSQPKQNMVLVLADGSSVYWYIEYVVQQQGWFANFQRGDWAVNGLRLTTSPNLLRKWIEIVPFGLGILTAGDVEPLNSTDFVDGTATVYLLEADDLATVESTLFANT